MGGKAVRAVAIVCLAWISAIAQGQSVESQLDPELRPPGQLVRPIRSNPPVSFASDELIVRFGKADAAIEGKVRQLSSAERNAALTQLGGGWVKRAYSIVPGLCLVKLAAGKKAEQVLATSNKVEGILYAEPNYELTVASTVPNDKYLYLLWGLNNTGQDGGTAGADIDAPKAWDISTGGQDVIVAVIDTGIDYTHADLAGNMWMNTGEIAGNGIDDDGNGFVDDVHGYDFYNDDGDPMDDHSHGTHVAGTIGAVGNNGIGVAGVCWNVRLMALKFLSSGGRGITSDAISCIEYAVQSGAKVLSNSWGGPDSGQALKDAIDAAGAAGVLFVAAAGNDNLNTDTYPIYPSSYTSPNIISVMATDRNDARSIWSIFDASNYGATSVDIGAPGTYIVSCYLGGGYIAYSGTSMATPHVAGACALIWSYNPSLTATQVKDIVLETVDPTLPGLCVSGGRLNLYNALRGTTSSEGHVYLNREFYSNSDTIEIMVPDSDLQGMGTQDVTVVTTGGDTETVALAEDVTRPGIFVGTIPTSAGPAVGGDGTLQVSHGQTITATYQDLDDGTGNPATATDTATVDCEPPVISNVQIDMIGDTVIATFDTDEPTTALARCGLACGGPYSFIGKDDAVRTTHAIRVAGLASETTYYLMVEAADRAGNPTTDNNSGACYSFTTTGAGLIRVPQDYPTIQLAIDASWDGGLVLIDDGVYTGDGNRDIDFKGKAITVTSKNGPEKCIIDCQSTEDELHRGFEFHSGEGSGSVLAGVTITGGDAPDGLGGAIKCVQSSPTILGCILRGNAAWLQGGGIYCEQASPTIQNCRVADNVILLHASIWTGGGGIYAWQDSSPRVSNCIISGNRGPAKGGGICVEGSGELTITNCTITNNTAWVQGGGIYCNQGTITNCILWNNLAAKGPSISRNATDGTVTISFCDLEGGQAALYADHGTFTWGPGNIDADPTFALNDDYHLMSNSPCIDAGTNDLPGGLPPMDPDGLPRLLDGNADGTATVDMGAYEYDPQSLPVITCTPGRMEFFALEGKQDAGSQVLSIRNRGGGTLAWQAVEDCSWLEVEPSSGESTGQINLVTFRVNTIGLAAGKYTCQVLISSDEATNSPYPIQVTFSVGAELRVPDQYPTIQDAVDASVDGGVVIVADGVYTGYGNRDIDFRGKVVTVRSENGPEDCIIDCQATEAEPHRAFSFRSGENGGVDGFTLTGGYGPDESFYPYTSSAGGAIFCVHSSPTITNCVFDQDVADWRGGAIAMTDSCSPEITNNVFTGNSATWGGAIYVKGACDPTIGSNLFEGNSAGDGGAVYLFESTTLAQAKIINNTFTGNTVNLTGGGGAIYCQDSQPLIAHNLFTNNASGSDNGSGGAIYCTQGDVCPSPRIVQNTLRDNYADRAGGAIFMDVAEPYIVGNIIANNVSGYMGGGIGAPGLRGPGTIADNLIIGNRAIAGAGIHGCANIVNCTIVGNTAKNTGGAISITEGNSSVVNCIIRNNTASFKPQPIFMAYVKGTTLTVSHCSIQGGQGAVFVPNGDTLIWGAGNIDVDPRFVGADDYHLFTSSLCVDAGDSSAIPSDTGDLDGDGDTSEPIPYDLGGVARVLGGAVDIGAYECLAGDTNHDGDVDLTDLGALAGGYGMTTGATWAKGDFDGDGDVDLVDLGALAGNYGYGVSAPLNFAADAAKVGLSGAKGTTTDDNGEASSNESKTESLSPIPGGSCIPTAIVLMTCLAGAFFWLGSYRRPRS
jgi:parallel beta-helix repeat protein/predicted outer membrane repeat protein